MKGKVGSPRINQPKSKISSVRTKPPKTVKKTAKSLGANRQMTRVSKSPGKKIRSSPKSASLSSLRRKAVKLAWRQEQQLVKAGGGTRNWTDRQRAHIAKHGKLKHFEGHHMRSVKGHTKKWAGDPRNIKFVTRREHLREHRGNFRNPTTGKLVDRQKLLRLQKNRVAQRRSKK